MSQRVPRSVVLWDVAGTLVERVLSQQEFLDRALGVVGLHLDRISPVVLDRAQQMYLENYERWASDTEEEEGVRQLAVILLGGESGPPDPRQVERLQQALAGYFDSYRPVPGIPELLVELAGRGIRQGVVSNWPASLRAFLDHHGLSHLFIVIACSGVEGVLKPDETLFARALHRLGTAPHQAVYVGNNPLKDIAPARALGMQAIHFDPIGDYLDADARDALALRRLLFDALGLSGLGP